MIFWDYVYTDLLYLVKSVFVLLTFYVEIETETTSEFYTEYFFNKRMRTLFGFFSNSLHVNKKKRKKNQKQKNHLIPVCANKQVYIFRL